jgi:hypothetical protein
VTTDGPEAGKPNKGFSYPREEMRALCQNQSPLREYSNLWSVPRTVKPYVLTFKIISYSGSRDQEDRGSKSPGANSSRDPILKNPSQKRAGRVAQGVAPEFKPSVPGANSSRDPILKNPSQKRAGRVAQGVAPEFKPSVPQKKKILYWARHWWL